MPKVAIRVQLGGAALPGDAAALDDGVAVGELHQPLDVLVDHQDGLAAGSASINNSHESTLIGLSLLDYRRGGLPAMALPICNTDSVPEIPVMYRRETGP